MLEKSLTANAAANEMEDTKITYNLFFKNALYSLECYKAGSSVMDENGYCYLENVTDDEGEAELFLHNMAHGKVFPVHIKDMARDYFN